MIGKTVAHYKILEKLGEGGMGVVYKAEDLKLTRTVALKFLPHGLEAQQPERERFLQEARAAAILNHTNICTVYDIQEHEGQQFIVMEYVDGTTVRREIDDGRLKIENGIKYAIQIGEALQEAHAHGIVHRDIKAENIMVNSKGQVKVMDFGLAKLKGSLKLTKTSSTVGTLAYMAPEQIEGGEVDARSDIFSFGVVLYEMLTGHTPFRGEHEAAMVYSIVNEEPTPIQKYLPDVNSELVHILDRALEKDPEDRYQNVHDMVIDLHRLKKQTGRVSRIMPPRGEAGEAAAPGGEHGVTPQERTPRVRGRKVTVTVIGAAVLVAGVLYLLLRPPSLARLNPNMTTRVIDVPFAEMGYPTLSSDGKWIAFYAADIKGTWDVYFMHVGSTDARRVTFDSLRTFQNLNVTISPDRGHIAYDGRNAKMGAGIFIASPLTGESRKLVDSGYAPTWRSDGERIGYMRWGRGRMVQSPSGKPEFWSIRPDGTDKRREFADTATTSDVGRLCFAWSPDLKSVAYLSTREGNTEEVYVRNLQDGSDRQLTHLKSGIDNLRWADNGWIFFSSNKSGTSNLWMVSPDGGDPIEFTKGTAPYLDVGMSDDCRTFLGYQRMQVNRLWIADLDGSDAHAISSNDQLYYTPSFSLDGQKVVFAMGSGDPLSGVMQLCVMERDGQRRRQILASTLRVPILSPDGKWIAYAGFEKGSYTAWVSGRSRCYVVDVTNPTDIRRVGGSVPVHWTDSRSLVCWDDSTISAVKTSVDGSEQRGYLPDSVGVLPLPGGAKVLLFDLRAATQGLYVGSPGKGIQMPQELRLIRSFKPSWTNWSVFFSPGITFVLLYNRQLEFWRIMLPSGTMERLHGSFPELVSGMTANISNDGKSIIYAGRVQTRSKLVLMENPFE